MTSRKYFYQYIPWVFLMTFFLQVSCKKYLDKKPYQNLAVPSTLKDLQSILDNQSANNLSCQFLEFVADNYFLSTTSWNNLPEDLRKNYIWASDAAITNNSSGAWNNPYKAIYECNFVLDLLPKISFSEAERSAYNNIRGTALFYRAFMFHELAQLFCKPYTSTTDTELGIVLKTTSDVNISINRSTIPQTYEQVLKDVKEAVELLPVNSLVNTRPNKSAAYGLLGRVYLSMSDYTNAARNAEAALNLAATLLDFNTLTPSGNPVLPVNPLSNPEILYLSNNNLAEVFNGAHTAIVDSGLYQSYSADDWRQTVFFGRNSNGTAYWKGSYFSISDYSIFDGIAVDEIYLIRAECRARTGNVSGAMDDLNLLLRHRYKTGTFTGLNASDAADALSKILVERRKELVFRGLRWSDLRRLNLEGANITLNRILNNTQYKLPPNDPRTVLFIPEVEINRSGIPQNIR